MKKSLPERPDWEQLKKQAKDLLNDVHAGRAEALARLDPTEDTTAFALHDAQRVLARDYGFASWAKLKLHVETRTSDAAEARLIEAVLEGEKEVVRTLLDERPELAKRSVFTCAALGDEEALRQALVRDPALARVKGGPRNWELLLYVCFGQSGGGDRERKTAVQLLLEHGASANATWLHPDWPEAPLSALYGATGVNNYPEVARGLLQAGANPNDGESVYHAAEHHHVACLEVLAEFGADFSGADRTWGNTPLYFLLGWTDPSPSVRAGIRWLLERGVDPNVRCQEKTLSETALHAAVSHEWEAAMIELLLQHGADPAIRRADGRTAYALAVRGGRDDLARLLIERGSPAELSEADEFLGRCMRADFAGAREMLQRAPDLIAKLNETDRSLPTVAARAGRAAVVTLMGELGFDLEAKGELGAPPLHWASWHGEVETVRALLARGVATDRIDERFGAPPIGWCAHGSAFCRNPKGDYGAVAEALIRAGSPVPEGTEGAPEVVAVIKRYRVAQRNS